ncbi:MAG TPA: endonuclease/exonuclease/phosphatase family protein [Myxococcota bacterium]|nr:endonuclease/exonuclease/phosphatase family protein [Myxococcota bacterium]HRY93673.1 endonuclease/exonuclease/phosphatase family protein [Myxococcota bacterium]
MPFYHSLNSKRAEDRRTAEGLIRLRTALRAEVPAKTLDSKLLLASWNIREFGGTKSGGREPEPLFYLAEVISAFDLVAVQEVRGNLDALDRLMNILGGWWKYLVTDVTQGQAGNAERLAFLYDERKVRFGGLAGELAGPSVKKGSKLVLPKAFARSPYLVGFRAGWFKFSLVTGHLYYGASKPDDPQRLEEMKDLVKLLKARVKDKDHWARNVILLGDFNIFSDEDETFKELEKAFDAPAAISGLKTNVDRTKPFDQIAFLSSNKDNKIDNAQGGVFDFYKHVYRDGEEKAYKQSNAKRYRTWRTYKMSDHLPLWTEVAIDFGDEYLGKKAAKPNE